MKTYTLLLSDGYIITINSATEIKTGHLFTVTRKEDDGFAIKKTETVVEILDIQ